MINQPFAVVPVLHSVLFHFTHQVMSGYSIVLIRDPARGTSQVYLRVPWTLLHSNSFFHTFSSFPGPLNFPLFPSEGSQNRFDCRVPRPLAVLVIFPNLC